MVYTWPINVTFYIGIAWLQNKLLIDVHVVLASIHKPDHTGAIQCQAVISFFQLPGVYLQAIITHSLGHAAEFAGPLGQ